MAKLIGIYNINEYFNAVLLSSPLNKPPIKVDPLLLIPGTTATTWVSPITIESVIDNIDTMLEISKNKDLEY